GKSKAPALANRRTEHAPQVRAHLVRAALVGIVAGHALVESLLALRSVSGRSLWKYSPATIDDASATIPANSTQPAMVLKRSSMKFPWFLRSRKAEDLSRLLRGTFQFIKPRASAPKAS